MAEEFGFEQRLGDGAAVEGHEAVLTPRAGLVEGAGNDLLARAGLAGDEHRGRARCDGFDHLAQVAHRLAAANHAGQAVALLELVAQVGIFGAQPPLFQRRLEDVHQLFELEWFADEVGGAALDGVDRVFNRAVAGDDDADDAGVAVERRGQHGAAVDARQPQVRHQDVEREAFEPFERLLTRRGFAHAEAGLGQPFGHDRTQGIFVVDEQQVGGFRQRGDSRARECQYSDTRAGRPSTSKSAMLRARRPNPDAAATDTSL